MLTIFDDLFLLALDEEKGNIFPFAKKSLVWGIPGAVLAELALAHKICSNENRRLELMDPSPTGDEVLDACLAEIQGSEKARKLTYWVGYFSKPSKELRSQMGARLVAKNVLYQEDKRLFRTVLASQDGYPVIPTRFEMKTPLRKMILADGASDPSGLALLSVAGACDLLGLIFTQDEISTAKLRIHEKVLRAALETPAMEAVEEIEQAVAGSMEDDGD